MKKEWRNSKTGEKFLHLAIMIIIITLLVMPRGMWILVPWSRIEPVPLAVEEVNLNHSIARGITTMIIFKICRIISLLSSKPSNASSIWFRIKTYSWQWLKGLVNLAPISVLSSWSATLPLLTHYHHASLFVTPPIFQACSHFKSLFWPFLQPGMKVFPSVIYMAYFLTFYKSCFQCDCFHLSEDYPDCLIYSSNLLSPGASSLVFLIPP